MKEVTVSISDRLFEELERLGKSLGIGKPEEVLRGLLQDLEKKGEMRIASEPDNGIRKLAESYRLSAMSQIAYCEALIDLIELPQAKKIAREDFEEELNNRMEIIHGLLTMTKKVENVKSPSELGKLTKEFNAWCKVHSAWGTL